MAVAYPLVAGALATLGIPVGAYIGRLAASEFRSGERNVRVFSHIMIASVAFFLTLEHAADVRLAALASFALGSLLLWHDFHTGKEHPRLLVMVLLGIAVASMNMSASLALVASLAFVACVATGSLLRNSYQELALQGGVYLATYLLATLFSKSDATVDRRSPRTG